MRKLFYIEYWWYLLIFFFTESILYFLVFLKPIWFIGEIESFIGYFVSPILAGIVSCVLFCMAYLYGLISKGKPVINIIINTILTGLILYLTIGNFHVFNYLNKLDYQRTYYDKPNVISTMITDIDISNAIQMNLPDKWKITAVYYDPKENFYWISVLKPSFLYGSIRYISVYSEGKIIDKISEDKIWEDVGRLKHVPITEQYTSLVFSPPNNVAFSSTANKLYSVQLKVINNRITISEGKNSNTTDSP